MIPLSFYFIASTMFVWRFCLCFFSRIASLPFHNQWRTVANPKESTHVTLRTYNIDYSISAFVDYCAQFFYSLFVTLPSIHRVRKLRIAHNISIALVRRSCNRHMSNKFYYVVLLFFHISPTVFSYLRFIND